MSFNRSLYDTCEYRKRLQESTSVLNYVLDPNKHYNCSEAAIDFGLIGGNNVSRISGNIVDLENDLQGRTRPLTRCPDYMYMRGDSAKYRFNSLPMTKMIQYAPRQKSVGYSLVYPGERRARIAPRVVQAKPMPGLLAGVGRFFGAAPF